MKASRQPAARHFPDAAAFRTWLARNHATVAELVVRCYKVHESGRGLGYKGALDEALCFGWIDGIRRRLDEVSFTVRFTPRRPKSIWSRINIRRVGELTAAGRMAKPGLNVFESRDEARTGLYSFERAEVRLPSAYAKQFKARKAAWSYYQAQPPWYRRISAFWVMSAKREETRARRFELLMSRSAERKSIAPLERP